MFKSSMHQVVYQIWPRSFQDSNDDGIGDINGIIQRLDYLQDLGIKLIWLSPIYFSPNHDYGYDIEDYYSIQPEFGTMKDFDLLIKEAKQRGIGLIMDLVANHTSDQHAWFQAALKDPNSPYRDYYVFKPSKNGKEPNNWLSLFGGSAWTKLANEDLYYLTLFTPQQVDLNWQNSAMRQEIYAMMRFWLDKGIAGFRMDVINIIAKKEGYPDKNPRKKGYQFADDLIVSLPLSHDYLKEMYESVLKDCPGLFLGEGLLITPEQAKAYSGLQSHELDMMFHFDTILLGCGPLGKYDFRKLYHFSIKEYKRVFFKWQMASQNMDFVLGNFLSNHDNGRSVSRFGDDQRYRIESQKALLLNTLTARGTPFIYQGEEIGMTNLKLDEKDWKDFEAINDYQMLQSMMHLPAFLSKKIVQKMTRDQARTPVQWNDQVNAGFSTHDPWMIVNPNYKTINVAQAQSDPNSILNFTKQLIAFHQAHPVFALGRIEEVLNSHKQIIAYIRSDENECLLILINLDHKVAMVKLEEEYRQKTVLCNYLEFQELEHKMVFRPYEARIIQLINK